MVTDLYMISCHKHISIYLKLKSGNYLYKYFFKIITFKLKECVHLNWKDVTIQIKSINSQWSCICQSKIVANLTNFSSRVVFLHIYINVKGCVALS